MKNQIKVNQPPSHADVKPNPGGALGPPKNRVVARAQDELDRRNRDRNEKYGRSVENLAASLTSPQRAIQGVSSVFEKMTTVLSRGGGVGGALGKVVTVAGAVGGIFYEKIKESATSFSGLIDKGLYFEGSMTKMAMNVRSTGLSLEEFGSIAQEYGTAKMAGKPFLRISLEN